MLPFLSFFSLIFNFLYFAAQVSPKLELLIIGFLTIILFSLIKPFNDWSFNPNSNLFGQYGDFIGGFIGTIFSLVAAILLYKTLIAQQKSIDKQDESNKIQKRVFDLEIVENTFFNLLKTQQELTTGIKAYFHTLKDDFSPSTKVIEGREFFAYASVELRRIHQSIESEKYLGKFENDDEYLELVQMEIDEYFNPKSPNFCPPDEARRHRKKIIDEQKIRYANLYFNITKDYWKSIKNLDIQKRMDAMYSIFFQRYHYAIGHYFRHLYHVIKFVKEFKSSDDYYGDYNKTFVDFMQAQMSSFELMLLFYNANSFPKLLALLKEFNFLENLAEEDLISPDHNCIEGIKLKSRKELLGIDK